MLHRIALVGGDGFGRIHKAGGREAVLPGGQVRALGGILGQVLVVQEGQEAVQVHIAVQEDQAVVEVIAAIEGLHGVLIGQIIVVRVGHAVLVGGGLAGIQRVQQVVHGVVSLVGHVAGVLGEHRAVDGDVTFRIIQLEAHGLPLEQVLVRQHRWGHHAAHVDVHHLDQLVLRQAGDGIVGDGIIGTGVDEGPIGLVVHVEEHVLGRVLVRARGDDVLEDVVGVRLVPVGGVVADGKGHFRVVVLDVDQRRAADIVVEGDDGGVEHAAVIDLRHREAVQRVAGLEGFFLRIRLRKGRTGQEHRCREQQAKQFFHGIHLALSSFMHI